MDFARDRENRCSQELFRQLRYPRTLDRHALCGLAATISFIIPPAILLRFIVLSLLRIPSAARRSSWPPYWGAPSRGPMVSTGTRRGAPKTDTFGNGSTPRVMERFNTRRERLPGRPARSTLLGLPGLPDPNWQWVRRAFEVDDAGWLWMASANRDHIPDVSYPFEGEALYAIPPQGVNNLGNPIYHWSGAVKVMDGDTGRNALGLASGEAFEWKMTGRSDDGMVYALASTSKAGFPQDGGAWMGGNVLFCFQQSNLLISYLVGSAEVAGCSPETVVSGWFRFPAVRVVCSWALTRAAGQWAITPRRVSSSAA